MVLDEITEKSNDHEAVEIGHNDNGGDRVTKLLLLGAVGYPALEVLWRGRTHYSMAIAGAISALMIGRIRRLPLSYPFKTLLCGLGITGVELFCGIVWNHAYRIWDYRNMPLNYRGQVCFPFSLAWCGIGAVMLKLMEYSDQKKHPVCQ